MDEIEMQYEEFESLRQTVQTAYDERLNGWASLALEQAKEIQGDTERSVTEETLTFEEALEHSCELTAENNIDDAFGYAPLVPFVAHTQRVDPDTVLEIANRYAEYERWDVRSLMRRLAVKMMTQDIRDAVEEQRRPRRKVAFVEMDTDEDVDYDDLLDFCIQGEGQQNTPFEIEINEERGGYDVYRVLDDE